MMSAFFPSSHVEIGLEFCDTLYQIEASNKRHVREGMAFDVRVAVDRLTDADEKSNNNNNSKGKSPSKSYAILLADTVLIGEKENAVLTNKCTKELSEISYEIGSEDMKVEEVSDDADDGKELTKKDFV
jgi:nucleosome binding factor SPN SPT16 subunit